MLLVFLGALALPVPLQQPVVARTGAVESVQYSAAALKTAPKFRLGASPVATMGGPNASMDAELTSMGSPRFLADGRVVAVDKKEMHLVVFAATGGFQRKIGRKGGGPGEFEAPYFDVAVSGDTVVSGDQGLNKVMVVRANGDVLKELPLTASNRVAMVGPAGLQGQNLIMTPTGWVLPPNDSTHRPLSRVVSVRLVEGKLDSLFEIRGPLLTTIDMASRGTTRKQTVVVVFTRPDRVAAWGAGFAAVPDGRFVLEYRDVKGTLIRRVTVAGPRRPVTAAVKAEWLSGEVRRMTGQVAEGGQPIVPNGKAIETNSRFADSLPAIGNVAALSDGSVWVSDYQVSRDSPWASTLFSPTGRIIGRLEGSGSARPLAWGKDRVLLESKDEDGVITWRTYQIVRAP